MIPILFAFSIKDPILNTLKSFFQWIINSLKSLGDQIFQTVIDGFHAVMPTVNFAPVKQYWDQLNYFAPVSEFVTFLTLGFTLWLAVFMYKTVKSWIPTVSS